MRRGTLVEQAGKQSITVNNSPGFVTNRVMMLMVNEAMFLLHEGVSTVPDVDRLFKTCFGHKMGPLETTDLIGLDTGPAIARKPLHGVQRQQVPALPAAEAEGLCRDGRSQERRRLLPLRWPMSGARTSCTGTGSNQV